jgi:hypothetical protein
MPDAGCDKSVNSSISMSRYEWVDLVSGIRYPASVPVGSSPDEKLSFQAAFIENEPWLSLVDVSRDPRLPSGSVAQSFHSFL